MGLIVELARQVLENAERLEQQLEAAGSPQPSFEPGTPATFPAEVDNPDIYHVRNAIADASQAIRDLALGPSDVFQYIVGAGIRHANVVAVVQHYDIVSHVPKDGSITFEDLAAKLGVNQDVLQRILRFGMSARLFQEKPKGSISNTALSDVIPLIGAWSKLILWDDVLNAFMSWPQALKTYDEAAGAKNLALNIATKDDRSFFERLNAQPEGMKLFTESMEARIRSSGNADEIHFKRGFDWASLGKGPVVDVGGGSGHILVPVVKGFPELNVIVQDLQSNEAAATAQFAGAGLEDRMSFQVQDFFKPQPAGLQPKAYFMKSILHDWNDADCIRILKPLIPGIEKGAKLFTMDRLAYLPEEGKVPTHQEGKAQAMDLLMWTVLGAKERNIDEWRVLAAKVDPRLKILASRESVGCDWAMFEWGF